MVHTGNMAPSGSFPCMNGKYVMGVEEGKVVAAI